MSTVPPFPNVVCWDSQSRPRVMNTIALDVLPAIFHATHSPAMLRRAGAAAGSYVPDTESGFLADFLDSAHEHVFDLVVGDSGSGKSHLIRWMYFELLRLNAQRGERWHIVLIPRSSANLHEVVAQVLRGFEGPVVQAVQRELAQARGRLTEAGARHRVLDELAYVLGDENLPARSGARKLNEDEKEIRRLLPDFLRDGAVRAWLMSTTDVVARLGHHVAGVRESVPTDPEQLRWQPTDLDVPPDVYKKTGSNAEELAGLFMNDAPIRQAAARLLNEAWADASGALLGLRRGNLGGAMIEMRKELQAQGRELLLLIEDMSVTQGLDEELLEALIVRPHERPDETLCTLRSVVGLTPDDADTLRDNIRGRVRRTANLSVPLAHGGASEAGQVSGEQIVLFAARYLNAARMSLPQIESWYDNDAARTHSLPSYCETSGCPNREACHAAFGAVAPSKGTSPYGLYPFTAETLLRLYEQTERGGPTAAGRTFNPRRLVGRVLNAVLESGEKTLATGEFPATELTAEFRLASVPAAVQVRLEKQFPKDSARLRRALEVYSPQKPGLPAGIAQALALPAGEVVAAEESVASPAEAAVADGAREHPPAHVDDLFDRWANGGRIEDRELNRWRAWVHEAVHAAIGWDVEEGFAALAGLFRRNYIHFEGQLSSTEVGDVRLYTPRSAQAAVALRALSRLHAGRLSAVEAETELEIALPWIDRWAEEVRRQLRQRFAAIVAGTPSAREFAAVLLAFGGVLRGAEAGDEVALLSAVLEPWPTGSAPTHHTPAWQHVWRMFQAYHGEIRAWLLTLLACSDGSQTEEMRVIDPSPVLAALADFAKSGSVLLLPPEARRWPQESRVTDLANELATHLPQALEQERGFCVDWLAEMDAWLGGKEPREVLKTLGAELEPAGDDGALAARLRSLTRKPIKQTLDATRKLVKDRDAQVMQYAARDARLMHDVIEFLREAGGLLTAAAAQFQNGVPAPGAGEDERALGGARDEIRQALQELHGLMTVLGEGAHHVD